MICGLGCYVKFDTNIIPAAFVPMSEYQIPRILWESLESVLLAQGRTFVKDAARRLQVDEKELLRRVMPSSKISVYLHDTQTETLQCTAYMNTNTVTHHCRRPVMLGSEFCLMHKNNRQLVLSEEKEVQRIQDAADRPPMWKQEDGTVIDSHGNCMGIYSEDEAKLTLFVID